MRGDQRGPPKIVQLHVHVAAADSRTGQHHVRRVRAEGHEAGVVPDGVDAVQQVQVGEPIHVDALCQDHHDAISAKANRLDLATEAELAYAPALVVIPDHHLVYDRG